MRSSHALVLVLGFGGALAACGDDLPTPGADVPFDSFPETGTVIDTAVFDTFPPPDSGPDTYDTYDTGDTRDTTGDVTGEPITGTALEGITVSWSAPLELCNAWREGATIEEELAHKVHVSLPAQTRGDLAFATLRAAPLNGVKVQTGPFAGETVQALADTRVTYYDVLAGEGYDALGAEIEHDLGPGGVLVESYSVTRAPGQTGEVEIGDSYEVRFAWAPAAGRETHPLEACALPATYETAVAVLAAPGGGPGALSATLVRIYGTLHSEISAGSYPVRLIASQVVLSDEPWRVFQATGPWAQTYAAQHHNWGETSRIDFSRDLGSWYTVFAPLARGEPIWANAVAKVQLADVGGGGDGTATITRLGADGTPTDVVFQTGDGWRRVDKHHLGRELALTCGDGTVGAVGFGDHVAQLMLCPDAGGPRGQKLVGVVPVLWQVEPGVVGQVFAGSAIGTMSGRLGWVVAIGAGKMIVEPQENDGFIIDVLDAGGTSVSNTYATLYDLGPVGGWDAPIDAAAEGVTVKIARRWAAQGVGESSIYAAESMSMTWGDNAYTVEAWDRLEYVNSHHNWQDTLAATTDDGHVLHWSITYDFEAGGLTQRVWVTGPNGAEVLAPTIVTSVGAPE